MKHKYSIDTLEKFYTDLSKMSTKDYEFYTVYYDLDTTLPKHVNYMIIALLNIQENIQNADFLKTKIGKYMFHISDYCLKSHLFKVEKKIGEGGFGTVYKVMHKRDPRPLVFKIQIYNSQFKDSIEDENKIQEYLNQHGIGPTIYDAWVCKRDKVAITVMERWEMDLYELFMHDFVPRKQPLPAYILDEVMVQVFKLHKLGFIHGDIKPLNILVRKNPNDNTEHPIQSTLSDFGYLNTIEEYKKIPEWVAKLIEYHYNMTGKYKNSIQILFKRDEIIKYPIYLDFIPMMSMYLNMTNAPHNEVMYFFQTLKTRYMNEYNYHLEYQLDNPDIDDTAVLKQIEQTRDIRFDDNNEINKDIDNDNNDNDVFYTPKF